MILWDMSRKWTMTKKINDASKGPKSVAQNWCFLSFSKIFKREDFVVKILPWEKNLPKKTKNSKTKPANDATKLSSQIFFTDKTLSWRFFNLKFAFFLIFRIP